MSEKGQSRKSMFSALKNMEELRRLYDSDTPVLAYAFKRRMVEGWTCAFGLTLYKTFRRHGLQLLAGLIQPGVADAMEGTVDRGRTHAVRIEAQGRGEHVFAVSRVRHFPCDWLQDL